MHNKFKTITVFIISYCRTLKNLSKSYTSSITNYPVLHIIFGVTCKCRTVHPKHVNGINNFAKRINYLVFWKSNKKLTHEGQQETHEMQLSAFPKCTWYCIHVQVAGKWKYKALRDISILMWIYIQNFLNSYFYFVLLQWQPALWCKKLDIATGKPMNIGRLPTTREENSTSWTWTHKNNTGDYSWFFWLHLHVNPTANKLNVFFI